MGTVIEDCSTKEQHSVVCFLWAKGLNGKDIRKEMLFMVGSVCRIKQFTTGSRNYLKDVQKSHCEIEVQKWLRQQSENFCASGFNALVK
jgi:hypothetical protein